MAEIQGAQEVLRVHLEAASFQADRVLEAYQALVAFLVLAAFPFGEADLRPKEAGRSPCEEAVVDVVAPCLEAVMLAALPYLWEAFPCSWVAYIVPDFVVACSASEAAALDLR